MKIRFLGAAQTVTGSHHLLSVGDKRILIDFGLFQGRRTDTYEKNKKLLFEPSTIDAMLLTHAHIDHSGNIPNLSKNGFSAPIYATSATVALCQIMLRDSAYLQEKDIEWLRKKKNHKNEIEPLYTIDDVLAILPNFVGVQYSKPVNLFPNITATFFDAGHILGSAGILIEVKDKNATIRIGFTGDIGRKEMPILRDPVILDDLDYLIIETTYANKIHSKPDEVEEELAKVINETYTRKGKIIIPAFAVGRTQMLVYMLHKLFDQNRIPVMPIYVDSPLAVAATNVFQAHPECFDHETYELFLNNFYDPFGFYRLKYIRSVDESKKLNEIKEPHIIISASGMAEGGRILHHLMNNVGNPNNMILFVGYAAENTLARKIMDGNSPVKIFGNEFEVKAKIKTMDYFSAHADKNDLLEYVGFSSPKRLKKIFLVHGEESQAIPFQGELIKRGYKNIFYPKTLDEFELD